MRIDKFLNTTNIVKRRTIANDMLEHGVVSLNGMTVKPSKEVKCDDIIEIKYLEFTKKYQVLQIPTTKTVAKDKSQEYAKELL